MPQFQPSSALVSLDGWTLHITCSACGLTRSKPGRELFRHAKSKGAELKDVLPRLKRCCGAPPKQARAVCTWAAKYRTTVPEDDITHIMVG